MEKENIYNLPNFLSVYRIFALPFITWAVCCGDKHWFVLLISINLVTDILDGFIARRFKLETKLGAKLDSVADMGTYLMAVLGMIVLERAFVNAHAASLVVFLAFYFAPQLVSLVKFRNTTSLHLYSSKIIAYIQGIFIFTFFIWGNADWFFYFMIVVSCISYLEELVVVLLLSELRSNVRSVYFIRKENKTHQA